MRIGILTYHRSHNYGAMLQAIALRFQLEKLGHEAYFIDYWPEYHRQMYALLSFRDALAKLKVKTLISNILLRRKRQQKIEKILSFINHYIVPYCQPYCNNERYDIVIYGSDQIWRKQSGMSYRFNPVYFGENILQTEKHVSYAASMGIISMDEREKALLQKWLQKFSRLSVREKELQFVLEELGVKSTLVLDPTLLLKDEEWDQLVPSKPLVRDRYILYYRLQKKAFNERAIKKFASSHHCKLISLDGAVRLSQLNTFSTASPTEFLSLIKHAEYVFTSSYHGLIFSLIYKRPFFASFKENSGRAESILKSLGLSQRLLTPKTKNFGNIEDIKFDSIEQKIEDMKASSISFLKSI